MTDSIGSTGITINTLPTLVNDLTSNFQSIYGSDINVNSNSPDGQIINIFSQAGIDIREQIANVFNSFSRSNCTGVTLDQRANLINVTRLGATFTIQPIQLIITQNCTLQGLDTAANDINGTGYTVADNSNNQYILLNTISLTPGTYTLNFRAAAIGLVEPVPNSIIVPITIVLGVSSINNPGQATIVGQNEESDFAFRTRCDNSVSIASTAQNDSLRANLLALNGVIDAYVYENIDGSLNSYGVPTGGIWIIVDGGTTADIANVIYAQLNANSMTGNTSYAIGSSSGQVYVIKYDVPVQEPLYIKFNLQPTKTGMAYDTIGIANNITENLTYKLNEYAETSKVTAAAVSAIQSITGNAVPIDVKISNDGFTWVDYLTTTSLNNIWEIISTNISITVL